MREAETLSPERKLQTSHCGGTEWISYPRVRFEMLPQPTAARWKREPAPTKTNKGGFLYGRPMNDPLKKTNHPCKGRHTERSLPTERRGVARAGSELVHDNWTAPYVILGDDMPCRTTQSDCLKPHLVAY
ncbi:hypothetical protein EVAR_45058_1 [Eumeta japonica]|uniref:Uncharacterized protein n=1 Tax=Eumeta variegata TaxID=151549 RepID=A0A4C1ZAB6_EUMVA|nr:hypothetical protein EVAR_45058_1 [Eumeta japonica]